MKGVSSQEFDDIYPAEDSSNALEYCLQRLFRDKKHSLSDEVVKDLSFEELIAALNLAYDIMSSAAEVGEDDESDEEIADDDDEEDDRFGGGDE